MTYPHRVLRLVASGRMLGGEEEWSWGINFRPDFAEGQPTGPETVPAAVVTAVNNFCGSGNVMTSNTILDTVKLNLIGQDGRYVSDQTVFTDLAEPRTGAANTTPHPPQIALAVSFETGKRRGLAARGRIYLPSPGVAVQADGRISATAATEVATLATTMLNALNAALPDWQAAVVSSVGLGDSERITRVRVGRVLDTIRSRRGRLPEEYVFGAPLAV